MKNLLLLTVDIGNTTACFGVFKGKRIIQIYSTEVGVPQVRLRTEILKILNRIKKDFPKLRDVILCSVVPKVLEIIEQLVIRNFHIQPVVIGRDIKVPIKNNYRNPRQVGQDRLVCAFAAKCLYGQPIIVIDFGTAITLDVVSRNGNYEGGIIVPGIRLSAESLFQKTALLPQVKIVEGPHALIGKDTKQSILSGIFFGYGAMCSGLIDQITQRTKGKPKVIMTGGYTRLMRGFIRKKISIIDNTLVFKGMELIFRHASSM